MKRVVSSLGYFADYAANTEGATSQQDSQFVNTLSSVASDYARLEIPIESIFETSSNTTTQNVSAGYYVTVINHHAISGRECHSTFAYLSSAKSTP